ncbi:hypothetical protein BST61_g8432 [Cercospora zeina]
MPFGPSQESPTTRARTSGDRFSSEDDINKGELSTAQDFRAAPPDSVQTPHTRAVAAATQPDLKRPDSHDGPTAAPLEQLAQELRHDYAKLARGREGAENMRLEVQAALLQSSTLRGLFCESQRRLTSYIRDKGGGNGLDQATFLSLCGHAIADSNAADAQATTASILEGKLSSQGYRLKERELAFSRRLEHFLTSTGVWHSAQLDHILVDNNLSTTSQHTRSPNIDPCLELYYEKAGEVGLLGEELADLDIEHQQAHSQRALERDQCRPPSETESHHERTYMASRATLEKRLADAIAAAEDARKQYLVTGFDSTISLPDLSLDDFALPEPILRPRSPDQHHVHYQDGNSIEASSPSNSAERAQGRVLAWASQIHEVAEKPTIRPVTNEDADGASPLAWVTQEEVDAMHRIDLDKGGFVHVHRPRRNSSVSHLRWKVHEANKQL